MSFKRLGDYIQLVDKRNTDLEVTNLLGINITKNFMPSVANVSGTDLSKYKIIKKEVPKTLGDYIQQSDERNSVLETDNLLGISVNKIFIPTKSKKERLDLSKYKIVRPRQFGYVSVTSRNGEKISIAILDGEAGLVSSTYTVFKVKDTKELLPEYLYLFFQRTEFDRYARFNSWGSARETFDWADMCNVRLPIPDIKIQKAIVTIYHTLEARKNINDQLKESIKPLCPVLMKGVVEDMEVEIMEN